MFKALRLYKYKSILDLPHLVDFINGKIWLQPCGQLNDPYEGYSNLRIPQPNNILENEKIFNYYINDWKKYYPNLTEEKFKKLLKDPEIKKSFNTKHMSLRHYFGKHGIFCLAGSNSNIPMWAHYGNNHKGYCVIFELNFKKLFEVLLISEDKQSEWHHNFYAKKEIIYCEVNKLVDVKTVITRVNYMDQLELPEIIMDEMINIYDEYEKTKYLINNSLGVKHKDWEYEDEYRLILNINSIDNGGVFSINQYIPFLKCVGLILGMNLTSGEKQNILRLCKNNNFEVYQATLSSDSYKIKIEPMHYFCPEAIGKF